VKLDNILQTIVLTSSILLGTSNEVITQNNRYNSRNETSQQLIQNRNYCPVKETKKKIIREESNIGHQERLKKQKKLSNFEKDIISIYTSSIKENGLESIEATNYETIKSQSNLFTTNKRKKNETNLMIQTYRWHNLIEQVESYYSIDPGLLAGLIIHESLSKHTMLNNTNEGSAGLTMFMPGTMKLIYDEAKIYKNATTSRRDEKHGKSLRKLVNRIEKKYAHSTNKENNITKELIKYDSRFNPAVAIWSAGQYLSKKYHKKDNLDRLYNNKRQTFEENKWDEALSAYNAGRPISGNKKNYVEAIRKRQDQYLSFIDDVQRIKNYDFLASFRTQKRNAQASDKYNWTREDIPVNYEEYIQSYRTPRSK
jgi:hypothetical protein